MPRLLLQQVSFAFDVPLFEGLDVDFPPGFSGLVGENGAGKTTLLRLLTGELVPTQGRVLRPPRASIALCPQTVTSLSDAVREFSWDWEGDAPQLRSQLHLEPEQLERWNRLSAGERRRWQIGAALSANPEALLLDEPTNHLDVEGRELLLEALAGFDGIGIVVSHDRSFLDALTRTTVWLERGKLTIYPMAYSGARELREGERGRLIERRAILDAERARLHQRRAAQRERALGANRDRSTKRRAKGPKDSDARSILAKNRAEFAAKRLAKDVSALETRVSRVDAELGRIRIEREHGRDLFADYQRFPKARLFEMQSTGIHHAERRLLEPTAVTVDRHDKIWIRGTNGAGKTTLLDAIRVQNEGAAERCLWLPQTLGKGVEAEYRRRLAQTSFDERGRWLSFVSALGTDPDNVLASPDWSPGELRKVVLARAMADSAAALVLDEPTNHLDIPSLERLEALLGAFPGAVLLVTHDERLGRSVATRVWTLERGRVVES